jgi:hypothetical protein
MLAGDPATLVRANHFFTLVVPFAAVADLDGTRCRLTPRRDIFIRQSTAPALRLLKLKPNFAASTVTITDGFGGLTGFINIPLPARRSPM